MEREEASAWEDRGAELPSMGDTDNTSSCTHTVPCVMHTSALEFALAMAARPLFLNAKERFVQYNADGSSHPLDDDALSLTSYLEEHGIYKTTSGYSGMFFNDETSLLRHRNNVLYKALCAVR